MMARLESLPLKISRPGRGCPKPRCALSSDGTPRSYQKSESSSLTYRAASVLVTRSIPSTRWSFETSLRTSARVCFLQMTLRSAYFLRRSRPIPYGCRCRFQLRKRSFSTSCRARPVDKRPALLRAADEYTEHARRVRDSADDAESTVPYLVAHLDLLDFIRTLADAEVRELPDRQLAYGPSDGAMASALGS